MNFPEESPQFKALVADWRKRTRSAWRKHNAAARNMTHMALRGPFTAKRSRRAKKWQREYARTLDAIPMPPVPLEDL